MSRHDKSSESRRWASGFPRGGLRLLLLPRTGSRAARATAVQKLVTEDPARKTCANMTAFLKAGADSLRVGSRASWFLDIARLHSMPDMQEISPRQQMVGLVLSCTWDNLSTKWNVDSGQDAAEV